MNAVGGSGRATGALLMVVLVAGLIVPYVMLQPLTAPPAAFLGVAAGMSAVVRLAVLQLVVGAGVAVGVAIVVSAAAAGRSPMLAQWLMALAVTNFVMQLVENGHWLTLLSVSQAHVRAGAGDAGQFDAVGIAVRSAWRWAHYSHIFVAVGWLFTLFLFLFRTGMVPRVLPAIGMGLSVVHFVGITLPVFAGYRMPYPALFGMPLGVGILATAAWLIVRGFREPAAPR